MTSESPKQSIIEQLAGFVKGVGHPAEIDVAPVGFIGFGTWIKLAQACELTSPERPVPQSREFGPYRVLLVNNVAYYAMPTLREGIVVYAIWRRNSVVIEAFEGLEYVDI